MTPLGPDDDDDKRNLVLDAVLFIIGLVGFIALISIFYTAFK